MCLATLAGCELLQPQSAPTSVPVTPHPKVRAYDSLRSWLDMELSVAAMETDEVVAELVKLGKPETPGEKFHFGLLTQRLKTHSSWNQARDAFREVSQATTVTSEQRQLAAILMLYNQSRINWYMEYRVVQADFAAMQEELDTAQQENELLLQKIQALTDLETSISTRKE